ncbi:alpha/beta hydrolase family protein [Scopulibacillus cellulosilyticus]|uniref:Alpha/beta hydrolase family protein n=1 Tax=Scopulibacillus cellulosilyticus TaxID=2665665 RepID=A0ABW2PYN1_9BACL
MSRKVKKMLIYYCVVLILFVSGCSNSSSVNSNQKNKEETHTQSKIQKHSNGAVASFKKITVKGLDPSLDAYEMMYWSEGLKVAAYVSVPKEEGSYNLSVNAHGGSPLPDDNSKHVKSPQGLMMDKSLLKQSFPGEVTLVPLYRGYGDSMGTIPGLYDATLDTNNAIDAVKNYLNKNGSKRKIIADHTSLMGTSFGGGVVLKLASIRSDIVSIVAISPYVGVDYVYPWSKKHQNNDWAKEYLKRFNSNFGTFNPSSKVTRKESINVKKINNEPVLMVQGTADNYINWHPVQEFYKDLKQQDPNVTFKLIEGGNHGLDNKREQLIQIINNW